MLTVTGAIQAQARGPWGEEETLLGAGIGERGSEPGAQHDVVLDVGEIKEWGVLEEGEDSAQCWDWRGR